MENIFVSYSRKDMDFVRKLAGDLESAGYDVWWDIADLRGGDDWVRTIPDAIASSQHVIVVLTPNSVESEWVRREYTQALALRRKIVPIMLEACTVPFALNTINYVNFMAGEYADNFNNLSSALGFTGEPPAVAPLEKPGSGVPFALRKYASLIIVGFILLLAFALIAIPSLVSAQTPTPTPTPTLSPSGTPTGTPSLTPTASATTTSSPTSTSTQTVTPTKPSPTPSITKQPFETLTYCVNSLYAFTINVRSGPGTNYAVLGEPLHNGTCLAFRAVNEEETWLLIAPGQTAPALQQYEGGWIFRELLGLGLTSPIDLPAVTLTATPTPSRTPTITPTETPPAATDTDTPTPTP